jgi:co-chaperonin GroES (HSP10)
MILPLRDLLLIEPITASGMIGLIHIPDITKSTRNQTFQTAKVIASGPKAVARPGTTVFVSEYFGDEIEVDGKKLRIGRERDCVGIIEESVFKPKPLDY